MQPASRPDAAPWPHTGAVLAGGAGRRMGRSKHDLVLPDGRTMLEVVAATLGEVCARIVVVGHVETGLRRVTDLRPDQGPLAGLEALLASGLDAQYLVCPCDMPLVNAPLLRRLTGSSEAAAVVFRIEGERSILPLPARISADLLPTVVAHLQRRQRAVRRFLAAINPDVVPVATAEAGLLANVNTPRDYRAVARLQSPP